MYTPLSLQSYRWCAVQLHFHHCDDECSCQTPGNQSHICSCLCRHGDTAEVCTTTSTRPGGNNGWHRKRMRAGEWERVSYRKKSVMSFEFIYRSLSLGLSGCCQENWLYLTACKNARLINIMQSGHILTSHVQYVLMASNTCWCEYMCIVTIGNCQRKVTIIQHQNEFKTAERSETVVTVTVYVSLKTIRTIFYRHMPQLMRGLIQSQFRTILRTTILET